MADTKMTKTRKAALAVAGLAMIVGAGGAFLRDAPGPDGQAATGPSLSLQPGAAVLATEPAAGAAPGDPVPLLRPAAVVPPAGPWLGGQPCAARLALSAAAGAMIDLNLAAPCHPGARAVIRHAGLVFTARTDADGRLALTLPALAGDAEVAVDLPRATPARARVAVPGLDGLDRIAVQWPGPADFALRPAAPVPGAVRHVLGDAGVDWPLIAEVRTTPAGAAGAVLLEAAITAESCGRHLVADVLVAREGAPVVMSEVGVTIPDCPAAAGIVDLGPVLDPRTLAMR